MKKLLLILLLVSPCLAASWESLNIQAEGIDNIYIDLDSIKDDGKQIVANIQTLYLDGNIDSSIEAFDCNNKKTAIINPKQPELFEWESVLAGSVGEKLLNLVCENFRNAKA